MFCVDSAGRKELTPTKRRRDGGAAERTMIVTDVPSIGVPSAVMTDGVIKSGPATLRGSRTRLIAGPVIAGALQHAHSRSADGEVARRHRY